MNEPSSHKPLMSAPPGSGAVGQSPGGSSRATAADGQRTVISSRPPMPNMDFPAQTALESAREWEGEQLGQFVLQKFIGGGGMGIVFRALDTTLGREVAVKVLSRDQSADEETLRRFRNEAQSAARLSHDNIAHVFYVGEDRGVHYIVFEFIEGVNIRDLVEQHGPLPLDEAVSYTHQIAQALEHASQRAVIHRDIKPSNVLIMPDGKAKLVDMGLARLNQIAQVNADLTASGVTLGTFDYISPEQARDPRSADVRSDLYSLGCSFFFMLTGRPPFPDGTVLQKLLQHQGDAPPDPREFRPELPPEVTRILARLLAKNPAHRYQQAGELIDDLAALGEGLGIPLGASRAAWVSARRRYPLTRWQHHLPWIVTVSALFGVVVALDFYWSPRAADTAGAVPFSPPENPAPQPAPLEPAAPEPPLPADPERLAPGTADGAGDAAPNSQASTPSAEARPDKVGSAPSGFEIFNKLRDALTEEVRKSGAAAVPSQPREAADGAAERSLDDPLRDATPPTVAAQPAAAGQRVLVVSDEPGPNNFVSLYAACSAARDGDAIELRYSGSRAAERAIEISNVSLTIRAAEGFRPVVVFQPQPEVHPFKIPPAMVSVAGGQLVASDVDWQFVLPPNVPPHWALFETRGCDLLELRNCTLTVQGQSAYHARVAFIDIKAPPGAKSMNMDGDVMEGRVVTVNLKNCVARGEATFLRDDELQSVRLNWDNGLLATSDRLLVAGGSSLQPHHDVRAELTLRHVTAMVAAGLVLLTNSEEAPYQLTTQIRCDDCIIAGKNRPPLIEQRGSDEIERYQTRFQWSGSHNFFAGFEVFWRIMNSAGQSGSKQLDFAEWNQLWHGPGGSQLAGQNVVVWAGLPGDESAFHTHVPSDYGLADDGSTDNPAVGGASDRQDAGFLASELPAVAGLPQAFDGRPGPGN